MLIYLGYELTDGDSDEIILDLERRQLNINDEHEIVARSNLNDLNDRPPIQHVTEVVDQPSNEHVTQVRDSPINEHENDEPINLQENVEISSTSGSSDYFTETEVPITNVNSNFQK